MYIGEDKLFNKTTNSQPQSTQMNTQIPTHKGRHMQGSILLWGSGRASEEPLRVLTELHAAHDLWHYICPCNSSLCGKKKKSEGKLRHRACSAAEPIKRATGPGSRSLDAFCSWRTLPFVGMTKSGPLEEVCLTGGTHEPLRKTRIHGRCAAHPCADRRTHGYKYTHAFTAFREHHGQIV